MFVGLLAAYFINNIVLYDVFVLDTVDRLIKWEDSYCSYSYTYSDKSILFRDRKTMKTLRSFRATDLYQFNHINLDALTETYSTQFYTVSLSTRSFS